jgi:LmbE family N-acetylglucosaminyl deacetylase/SAM-dependent methyltransferase
MTASFRHDTDGVAEADWAGQRWLFDLPRLALPAPTSTIVVLAAHPDDESLGAGGLIASAAAAGHRVVVLVASDGEGSHPDAVGVDTEQLRRIRRTEVAEALAGLGAGIELVLLGLPDGQLLDQQAAIGQAVLDALGTGPGWLVSPWSEDGHPDHAACDEAAAAALAERWDVRHFSYPIWWWHWAQPDTVSVEQRRTGRRFSLSPAARDAKRAALAGYRSQTDPLGPGTGDQPVLTAGFLAHFDRDYEIFFDRGRHPAGQLGYFDALYAARADPWQLAERHYEQRKRDIVLACLPQRRFERGFEPGCAIGELSIRLADRCSELVCSDISPAAVVHAAARLREQPHVQLDVGRIPADWPAGVFDLIVLSEVGYYCEDLTVVADRISNSLTEDGTLLLVHWRWPAADHPLTAETVHATIRQRCDLRVSVRHCEADFLLEVLSRHGRSVAQRDGLLP